MREARQADATAALIAFAADGEATQGSRVFDQALVAQESFHSTERPEGSWWDASRSGINLRGRQMQGVGLRNADLSRGDLAKADLTDLHAAGVKLRSACLEGTTMVNADLIGADLSSISGGEADFSGAMLEDADLRGAHLRFANFTDAILDGTNLSDADLWGASFRNASAERAILVRGRLDESVFEKALLPAADFTGASLRKAKLAGANLRGSTFRDAVLDGSDLSRADLSGAILPNVSLMNCTLTHTRFAGAWLDRTRMRANQLGGQVGEEQAGELEAAVESYIVLERNFLSLGSSEDASWAYLRRRRVGRTLRRRQSGHAARQKHYRAAVVAGALWLGDSIAEWLCDYGESLTRVMRAFLSIVVLFAAVYWLTGSLKVREGFVSNHAYVVINYLLFSLNSMTTVGTSEVALRPAGELGMLLSSLQTVLGTILLGLFGFVLGARLRN